MTSIGETFRLLREEIDKVETQHQKYPCPRCAGRGFRWIRWRRCHLCWGTGKPRINMVETAHRMTAYLDVIERRVRDAEELLGWADRRSRW